MDSSLWYNLLLSALTLVVTAATAFLGKWLKSKWTSEQLSTAKSIVATAVEAVEQIGKALKWDGPTKYVQAVAYFSALATKYGISLSSDQIKALIEQEVLNCQAWWEKLDKAAAAEAAAAKPTNPTSITP